MLCLDPSTENLPYSVLTMTVLGFNAEPKQAGSRCQKFSFGVYSVNKSLTLSPSMSHYGTGRSILSSVDQ